MYRNNSVDATASGRDAGKKGLARARSATPNSLQANAKTVLDVGLDPLREPVLH
jgi:hypothetical protein